MRLVLQILLTGATGFIGQNLAKFLMAQGNKVFSLGRNPCPVQKVEHIQLFSLEQKSLFDTLEGYQFDVVIHLAAAGVHPSERDVNTLIELNSFFPSRMVAAAGRQGARAIIVVGSSAEYRASNNKKSLKEDAPLETCKLYGATKAAGSILALALGVEVDIPVAVVRLFNVFGPGEGAHRLLPSLYRQLSLEMPVKLSLGTQVRDFIYIDDVCMGLSMIIEALIEEKLASGAYNLGTGVGHSVADFSRAVAACIGADETLLKFGALSFRPDDFPFVVADVSSVEQKCRWRPRFSMEQGIHHALSDPLFVSGELNS